MKNKKIRIAVILVAAVILVIWLSGLFRGGIRTEMVGHGNMEKSYSFDAIVVRNETLINSSKSGVLESMVKDREVVRRGKHVASIYESEIDEEAKAELSAINVRIDEIKRAREESTGLAIGEFRMESTMDLRTADITRAIENGDAEKVVSIHSELNLLNDKKNAIQNGSDYSDDILDSLMKSKAEFEQKLGSSGEDLFSPVAGIYSTNIDGFEEIITTDSLGTMTPYDFEIIYKMKDDAKKEVSSVCKIIDNSDWSVAFLATQKEIAGFKEGSSVYVRTKNSVSDSKARISYISTPVNGNYLVAVTSEVSCEWAVRDRFVTIDLIRNKYQGLKVPIKALRVVDGVTGVYTVVDGIVYFKKVNVLYKDSGHAIVEENNTQRGNLLLYDEVVVSSNKKLKEGDRIS